MTKQPKTQTTTRTNGKRIIKGLKDVVSYAKGDKTKGKSVTVVPSSGCVFHDLEIDCPKEICDVCD